MSLLANIWGNYPNNQFLFYVEKTYQGEFCSVNLTIHVSSIILFRISMYKRRKADDPEDTWSTNKHNSTMGAKSSPRYKIPDQLLSSPPPSDVKEQRDYYNMMSHEGLSYSKMLDLQMNKEGLR